MSKRSTYGQGRIHYQKGRYRAFLPDGKGDEKMVASVATSCGGCKRLDEDGVDGCEAYKEALRLKRIALLARGHLTVGTTLREAGEAHLEETKETHRSHKSEAQTFKHVLCVAPFIDDALEDTLTPTMTRWVKRELPKIRAKRAKRVDGKYVEPIVLDRCISWDYQKNAVLLLKAIWSYAKENGLVSVNHAADVPLPKRLLDQAIMLSYLSTEESELAMSCRTCGELHGRAPSDVELLVNCPHLPFEKRVAFTLAIQQAPREGELACVRWENVDFEAAGWWLMESWSRVAPQQNVPPKNGRARWQALLPRAQRLLHAWWILQGRPDSGYVFPSSRSKDGKGRYALGHDWGWAGSSEGDGRYRPGWWERLGIKTKIKFHEMRDTCATHLLSASWGRQWSMTEVSEHLGHRSEKVTRDRYAQFTRDAKRRAAQGTESDPALQKSIRRRPGLNPDSDVFAAAGNYAGSWAPEVGLEPTANRLTASACPSASANMRRKSPGRVRVESPAAVRNPDSETRYRGLGAAVKHADELLRCLAAGQRDTEHAKGMALAVLVDAPRAQQLAARVQMQLDEPSEDALRLAGLLSQLGSAAGARVLKTAAVGQWESENAVALVEEALAAATPATRLAVQVLAGGEHSWRRALELADELTQRQRDGHARAERRTRTKTYSATARRTARSGE